ncbi:MAG: acetate--CoA ligase family protein [Methanoregulaceae archaeon]|jgi:acetyl coenzyme A synthetase (ADP forming)-like protein
MTYRLIKEAEGYELLRDYGVPVPQAYVAKSLTEAIQSANNIGFPVVLKVISSQIIHKTDAGGVVLNIKNSQETEQAYTEILHNVTAFDSSSKIDGVLVEQQMPPGLELIIGGKTDATFGKVITVGLGGTLVELIKDVTFRILPIDKNDIKEMVHELHGFRLIKGFRKESPKDEETLIATIDVIAQLFLSRSEVAEFDINPFVLYEKGGCAVDARFYINEDIGAKQIPEIKRALPPLADIKSIAVVGASLEPNKVGYAVMRNLLTFSGNLYPVNPKHPMILGRKAYPTLLSIPGSIDIAVVVVPSQIVPQIVEEAGQKKIPLVIIISSGFRESGNEGKFLEEQVLSIAQRYGIRIMGPNCLGLMLPLQGINTTFDPVSPKPGKIAFISQSGAMVSTIVDWSLPEEIGFSAIISVGNQADLSFEDFIQYAGSDPNTKTIILYIEQVRDGKRFLEIVQTITQKKPIVAIKSGSSKIGQKAASSHTGSLAGSNDVYMAAFRKAGIIPVQSIREAFQAAELLVSEGYPKGIRAVVITNAGGFAVLSSDYAERFGIELIEFSPELIAELNAILPPDWSRENPIDMVGDSSAERYARTFDVMTKNQNLWDIAFVIAVPSSISDPIRVANELVRFSKHTHKMIVGCLIGGDSMKSPVRILREAHIPNFPDLEDAFRAVGNICRHKCTCDIMEKR